MSDPVCTLLLASGHRIRVQGATETVQRALDIPDRGSAYPAMVLLDAPNGAAVRVRSDQVVAILAGAADA